MYLDVAEFSCGCFVASRLPEAEQTFITPHSIVPVGFLLSDAAGAAVSRCSPLASNFPAQAENMCP